MSRIYSIIKKVPGKLSIIVGVYIGVYVAQNYELPAAPGPYLLAEKISNWVKDLDSNSKNR